MNFIKSGEIVTIKMGSIKAYVIGVCVRENSVEYNVSYFNNKAHVSIWLHSFEVELWVDNSKPAGFGNFKKVENILLNNLHIK